MLSSAEFTTWLGGLLQVLESYPAARQAVLAKLKELGLSRESVGEMTMESTPEDGGTWE